MSDISSMHKATLILIWMSLIFTDFASAAETRRFGGSGRPLTGEYPLPGHPPMERGLAPLSAHLDTLWEALRKNYSYRVNSGGIDDADREILRSGTEQQKLELKQSRLSAYLATLKSDMAAAPTKELPSLEIAEHMRKNKIDMSLASIEAAEVKVKAMIPETGASLAARTRANMKMGRGKGFAVADGLLLGSALYKAKVDSDIASDIEKRVCRAKVDDRYLQSVMLEEVSVQDEILKNCKTVALKQAIAESRKKSLTHFSNGRTTCKYEGGSGQIETLSQMGARQVLLYDGSGNLQTVRVLSQDKDFQQSFLEYSDFSSGGKVRYTAIRNKQGVEKGPDFTAGRAQFENEPLISFASRIHCSVEKDCDQSPESHFRKVRVADNQIGVTPQTPFGNIQQNEEFFIQAGKILGHFRQGIEQNTSLSGSFEKVCVALGGQVPEKPTSKAAVPGLRGTIEPKANNEAKTPANK